MEEQKLLQFFPGKYREEWKRFQVPWEEIQEIRLRVNQPVLVRTKNREYMLHTYNVETHREKLIYKEKDLEEIFRHLCKDSIYAYEEERRQGFMTITGGHRIGITGELVYIENQGYIAKYVRYMNIRIAHQAKGIAEAVMEYLQREGGVYNTLIVSPPGVGKTTLLRDVVRLFSNGDSINNDSYEMKGEIQRQMGRGMHIGLIDERGEVAGAFRGSATLDCGIRTDVITGGDKKRGTQILVRTFAPQMIAMDEIGTKADADAINFAQVSGCAILATIHGSTMQDVERKTEIASLLQKKQFQRILFLSCDEMGERYVRIVDEEGRELCGKRCLQESWSS